MHELIPSEIEAYRAKHPLVSFDVLVRDHAHAVEALLSFEAEIAVVLRAAATTLRLRDCLQYPVAMPGRSLAIRHLLQGAVVKASLPVRLAVESDSFEVLRSYAAREQIVSFQIRAGIPLASGNLIARDIDERDVPFAQVVLGQLRGRSLPIAASKFVDQMSGSLNSRYSTAVEAPRETTAAAPRVSSKEPSVLSRPLRRANAPSVTAEGRSSVLPGSKRSFRRRVE